MRVVWRLLLAWCLLSPARAQSLGEKAPDFEVRDLNGRPVRLSSLAQASPSGVVCLTFWCSFCASCRGMEQQLEAFSRHYGHNATIVALDSAQGESPQGVRSFQQAHHQTFPILLDVSGTVADQYGVTLTTTTLIVDAQGRLRFFGRFRDDQHEYAQEALTALLAGKPIPRPTTPKGG